MYVSFIWAWQFPHLRLLVLAFSGMYSHFWMWRMFINAAMWTFLTFCFCVPSFLRPPFIPSPLSPFNIAWGERSFVFTSRFPEACVSERQISRVLWTIRNTRFPKFADHNYIRIPHFVLPRFSLESRLYSPDFEVYLMNFVSQIRCAAKRDNMCLLSPSKNSSEVLSWDLFIGTKSCPKLWWSTEFRPFPATS